METSTRPADRSSRPRFELSGAAAQLGAVVAVAALAASVSVGFRHLVIEASKRFGRRSADAWGRPAWIVFVMVLAGLGAAVALGRWARRADPAGTHLGTVVAAPTARAWRVGAVARAGATLVASMALASMGREVAVLELGALSGDAIGTVAPRRRSDLVGAGIAAAFAAAYHAPLAGVCFVLDHVIDPAPRGTRSIGERLRFAAHVGLGALVGHVVATRWLGGAPLLAAPRHHDVAVTLVALGLAAPAAVMVHWFVTMRTRLERWADRRSRSMGLVLLGAVLVAAFPVVSGNGLESLRGITPQLTIAAAATLLIGRVVATSATLASGAPGGMFSPVLLVAGGTAAAALAVADRIGVPLGANRWDAVLLVAGVGVAVALRSPLVGALIVPEMTGRLDLLPVTALVVLVVWSAVRVVRSLDRPALD